MDSRAIVKQHTVFIDSTHRANPAELPCEYTVTVEPGLIACGQDEAMRLRLSTFTTQAVWGWLASSAASFLVCVAGEWTAVSAQPGAPSLPAVASAVNKSFFVARGMPADSALFHMKYCPCSNKYIFTSSDPGMMLDFQSAQTAKVYGFNAQLVGPAAKLISDAMLNPYRFSSICVKLSGYRPRTYNGAVKEGTGVLEQSDIIAAIPVGDTPPWSLFTWNNTANDFSQFLMDKALGQLRVLISDWDGNTLKDFPDHQLTLQIEVIKACNHTHAQLGKINDTLQTMLLDTVVNRV